MNPKRILIADDQPHMQRVLRQFLEREGYQVDAVSNGQMALAAILRNPPDLLLTDIQMPDMDGQQLCEALLQRLPQRSFPIIVMTSNTDSLHRDWAEAMPETTFIEKPLSMRLLVAKLAKIFGHGQPGAGGDHG